jgi:hypothetical protein
MVSRSTFDVRKKDPLYREEGYNEDFFKVVETEGLEEFTAYPPCSNEESASSAEVHPGMGSCCRRNGDRVAILALRNLRRLGLSPGFEVGTAIAANVERL